MFLRANGCLCAIGMIGKEFFAERIPLLFTIVGQAYVILLVHSLQLSVEATYHHILETVSLHLGP